MNSIGESLFNQSFSEILKTNNLSFQNYHSRFESFILQIFLRNQLQADSSWIDFYRSKLFDTPLYQLISSTETVSTNPEELFQQLITGNSSIALQIQSALSRISIPSEGTLLISQQDHHEAALFWMQQLCSAIEAQIILSHERNSDSSTPLSIEESYLLARETLAYILAQENQNERFALQGISLALPSPEMEPSNEEELILCLATDLYQALLPAFGKATGTVFEFMEGLLKEKTDLLFTMPQEEVWEKDLSTSEKRYRKAVQQFSDALKQLPSSPAESPQEQLEQSGKAFMDALIPIRLAANATSISQFLDILQQDPAILPGIANDLKEKTERGDLAWFGEDVASGRAFFTKERQVQLQAEIRHQSCLEDLEKNLRSFQEQLHQDIREGREIIHPNTVSRVFSKFFTFQRKMQWQALTPEEKKEWDRDWKRIVNSAYLKQEISRKEHRLAKCIPFALEKALLSSFGFLANTENDHEIDLRRKQQQAELEVMKTILMGEGLGDQSVSELQKLLEIEKRKARLEASGVPPGQITFYVKLLALFEKFSMDLHENTKIHEENIPGLPISFPPLAKQMLLHFRKRSVQKRRFDLIKGIITGIVALCQGQPMTNLEEQKKLYYSLKADLEDESKRTHIFSASFYRLEDQHQKLIQFYQKWGRYLVKEMIQGLEDEQEALVNGVCTGVTFRVASNDQRNPKMSGKDFGNVQIRRITLGDRFRQALHSLSVTLQKKNVTKIEDAYDIIYPSALLKTNNIKAVHQISFRTLDRKKAITGQVKALIRGNEKSFGENGVALLNLFFAKSGHALYVRLDRGQNRKLCVGRIGDPNVGLLEFTDPKKGEMEFFDCLADLVSLMYDNQVKSIELARLELL